MEKLKLAWEKVKVAYQDLLTALNTAFSLVLMFALENQNVVDEVLPFLPEALKPYAPVLGIVSFILVQFAKARDIRRRMEAQASA